MNPHQSNCFLPVARLPDYFKVALHGKQRAQTLTEEGLIVNQEYLDRLHSGSSTSSLNPLPRSVTTRTSPPSSCALSRTPSRPKLPAAVSSPPLPSSCTFKSTDSGLP